MSSDSAKEDRWAVRVMRKGRRPQTGQIEKRGQWNIKEEVGTRVEGKGGEGVWCGWKKMGDAAGSERR